MRVLVKRGTSLINDMRFSEGPIYIGRHHNSHVFLPDRSVSRQHAVMVLGDDGDWMIQDMGSANRTVLNGRPISKAPLHEGDVIHISDFSVEIHFENDQVPAGEGETVDMGDTIVAMPTNMPSVYKTTRKKAIHLAPNRINDLYHLNVTLAHLDDQETLLIELIKLLLKQFDAYHIWTGLRETTSGNLTCHGGHSRGGQHISLEQLFGKHIIRQSLQEECYILLPNIADAQNPSETNLGSLQYLRSAMIAPIVAPAGAYGVIYVDNGVDHASFTYHDLDYLTIVSTVVAALIEHIG